MRKFKRYFLLVGIIMILSLLVGCLGGGSSGGSKGYKLTVNVKDSKTGYTLAGAKVEVIGKLLNNQISNENGKAIFSNISGTVEIKASLSGFKTETKSFTVSKDESVEIRLATAEGTVLVVEKGDLLEKIDDPTVKTVVLGEDLTLEDSLLVGRAVNLNLNGKTITGDVRYNFEDEEAIEFCGAGKLVGGLIINAPNGTINNGMAVTGDIEIKFLASNTWNEHSDANQFVVSAQNITVNLLKGAKSVYFTNEGAINSLKIAGKVDELIADSSVTVEGANNIKKAVVNASGVVFDYPPAEIGGSVKPEILNPDPVNGDPKDEIEIAGPRFATVSKRDEPYFDFSTGKTSKTGGDIWISSVQFGTEHTMIAFENCNGIKFSASTPQAYTVEKALEKFRTLDVSDWKPSDPANKEIEVAAYDTLLLKTNEGRYVKLYILETRGHFNHDDRPAIDFAYLFLDEVDNSKPVLQSVTVVTEEGDKITKFDLEGVVEFELSGDPDRIIFNFNEVVFSNRPLERRDAGFSRSSHIWFNPEYHYQCNPYLSTSFESGIWVSSMTPPWSSIELKVGDEQFYADRAEYFTDLGYLYSDLFGNQITELPFEKILLKKID